MERYRGRHIQGKHVLEHDACALGFLLKADAPLAVSTAEPLGNLLARIPSEHGRT